MADMNDAFLYYEAGQALAAIHLGLTIRSISSNPAERPSEIVLARGDPKNRIILLLTGLAAERKGVGTTDPLRRMRNRMRIRAQIDAVMEEGTGTKAKRKARAEMMISQSQDRANAICKKFRKVLGKIVETLRGTDALTGDQIKDILRAEKANLAIPAHRRTPVPKKRSKR